MSDREFWIAIRAALLQVVDAIERKEGLSRTAEIVRQSKAVFVQPGPADSVSIVECQRKAES